MLSTFTIFNISLILNFLLQDLSKSRVLNFVITMSPLFGLMTLLEDFERSTYLIIVMSLTIIQMLMYLVFSKKTKTIYLTILPWIVYFAFKSETVVDLSLSVSALSIYILCLTRNNLSWLIIKKTILLLVGLMISYILLLFSIKNGTDNLKIMANSICYAVFLYGLGVFGSTKISRLIYAEKKTRSQFLIFINSLLVPGVLWFGVQRFYEISQYSSTLFFQCLLFITLFYFCLELKRTIGNFSLLIKTLMNLNLLVAFILLSFLSIDSELVKIIGYVAILSGFLVEIFLIYIKDKLVKNMKYFLIVILSFIPLLIYILNEIINLKKIDSVIVVLLIILSFIPTFYLRSIKENYEV